MDEALAKIVGSANSIGHNDKTYLYGNNISQNEIFASSKEMSFKINGSSEFALKNVTIEYIQSRRL